MQGDALTLWQVLNVASTRRRHSLIGPQMDGIVDPFGYPVQPVASDGEGEEFAPTKPSFRCYSRYG